MRSVLASTRKRHLFCGCHSRSYLVLLKICQLSPVLVNLWWKFYSLPPNDTRESNLTVFCSYWLQEKPEVLDKEYNAYPTFTLLVVRCVPHTVSPSLRSPKAAQDEAEKLRPLLLLESLALAPPP